MDPNSLDAIEFFQDQKKHLRVYYQTTKDNVIRESSYDDTNGWYVRGNGVVATGVKKNSPITVTRWNEDTVTHIRVYFLDSDNKIRECRGQHKADVTVWEPSTVVQVQSDPSEPKVADGSQLAVARPETNDNSLRIFYQEKPAAAPNAKSPIREIKFVRARGGRFNWDVQVVKIFGALANTRLSAVSAKPSGDVRLYYQAENSDLLLENFWDNRSRQWTNPRQLHRKYELALRAPIRAVSWFTGEQKEESDLSIRVFTVLKNKPQSVSELSFDGENWYGDTQDISLSYRSATQPPEYAALAVARRIDAPLGHPISLFHHLRENVIDMQAVPADEEQTSEEQVNNVVHPQGIPTSR